MTKAGRFTCRSASDAECCAVRQLVFLVSAFAFATAAPAGAEDEGKAENYRTTTVFGDDPCPQPSAGEIIVCGRLPESERYRIPKSLRTKPRTESGPSASWGSKVETLEAAQRFTMPGSCTAVGSFGQSGCTQAMIRRWFQERQALAREAEAREF